MLRSFYRTLKRHSLQRKFLRRNSTPVYHSLKSTPKELSDFFAANSYLVIKNVFNPEDVVNAFNSSYMERLSKDTPPTSNFTARHDRITGVMVRGQIPRKVSLIYSKRLMQPDLGIRDYFNPELTSSQLRLVTQTRQIVEPIISSISPLIRGGYSIYDYHNVSTPRCFHRDDIRLSIKSFLVIHGSSDMPSGPYAILKKPSNVITRVFELWLNRFMGSDLGIGELDSTLVTNTDMLPLYAETGDIIITRQDVPHGDFPALIPHRKLLLVQSYYGPYYKAKAPEAPYI